MSKITEPLEQDTKSQKVESKLQRARSDLTTRQLLYNLRRGYYDGTIRPSIERGHDLIYTQYAAIIVEKMSSYFMGNLLAIKLKSLDVSDDSQNNDAEFANKIIDRLYNDNPEFAEVLLEMAQTSSLYGDGLIGTRVEDGVPVHYSINNPQNLILGFRDDLYKYLDFYAYDQGVSVDYIKDKYGIEVGPMPLPKNQYVQGGDGYSTHNNPYGTGGSSNTNNASYLNQPVFMVQGNQNMAKYTVVHDFIENQRSQLFNDRVYFMDSQVMPLYHFVANVSPGDPTGLADFEFVAHLITKFDEKLSEEGDAVSMGVHHKIITDQNPVELQAAWKPNKTQAIKVPGAPTPGRLEILNTSTNVYNSERLINQLLNAIRTGSGLQELGQDQIAANVSGRAIAYMFQGVIQQVKKKRIRLNTILRQMVIDDLEFLAKSDPSIKKMAFDENGKFKFKVDVKYPAVLEQDEQIRIANIQTMRQGAEPLISNYSARLLLNDYIDDPIEEEKRIKTETTNKQAMDAANAEALAEAQMKGQMEGQQAAAPPQPQGQPGAAPDADGGAQEPQSIDEGGMEPQNPLQASGVASTPGQPGSAQGAVSPSGMMAQMLQQSTGNQQPQR